MTPLEEALAPRSDQLNADDLIPGPRVLKITGARISNEDRGKRVVIDYEGGKGKPWKACKTMGRAMVLAWAITDESQLIGKSVRVFRDPDVKFGDQGAVGGIRISHMSDISGPVTMKLTVSQGKKGAFTFHPLVTDATPDNAKVTAWVAGYITRTTACANVDEINALVNKEQKWLNKLPDALREQCDNAVSERLVSFHPVKGRTDEQHSDQFDDNGDDGDPFSPE